MKVYIPSYNRAGKVSTHLLFPYLEYKIVIPKSQYSDYKNHYNKNNLLVISDSKDGNVAKKRNAILDIMSDSEGYGWVADDDLLSIERVYNDKWLTNDEVLTVMSNLLIMANDIGAYYVGFNAVDDKLKYRGDLAPFSLTKPFYGIVGIIENGIRYDESLIRGEDVDFYFRQLKKHHLVVRDNRYKAVFNNKNKSTGIGKREIECAKYNKLLQKKYGSEYVRLDEDGVVKGVSQVYKGV